MDISVVSFSFSWCSAFCWLSLLHLIPNWSGPQTPSGVPRAPSAGCGFPYHISSLTRLISISVGGPEGSPPPGGGFLYYIISPAFLVPNSSDFLSSPSYIIVQTPTQSPTQYLEWNVWSSSSGNNCHAVQRSLSCISLWVYHGLLPCSISSAKSAYAISPHNCHRNVSLPSGASLWNGLFAQVEGQYTTYGCTTWTLTKRLEKKLDGSYTRMLRAILNKSWRQHPTRHQLYDHLPPITKTIQVRRTRHAGHCWRSKDERIRDVLLWTPAYGQAKAGRPARTYIQQIC